MLHTNLLPLDISPAEPIKIYKQVQLTANRNTISSANNYVSKMPFQLSSPIIFEKHINSCDGE